MNLEDFYVGADKATELGDESLEVSLLKTELGEISLPSKLVGFADPAFIGPESLLIETPADKARVIVTEADVSDEQDGSHYRVAYLSLLFNSVMRVQFEAIKTGSTVPHLNCRSVIELSIPLPEIATQRDVVNKSGTLSAKVARLESLYAQKTVALDQLKASLLFQAFTGRMSELP